MKHLKDIVKEMEGGATPANTMGMGNPMPPTDGCCGSEPLAPIKKKTKKKPVKEAFFDVGSEDERSQVNTMMRVWFDSVADLAGDYELDVVGDEINIKTDSYICALDIDMKKNPIPKGYKMGVVTINSTPVGHGYKLNIKNFIPSQLDNYIPQRIVDTRGSYQKLIIKIFGKVTDISMNKPFECEEFFIETTAKINDRPSVWLPKDCVFFAMNCRAVRSVHNIPHSCSKFRAKPEVLWNMLRDQLMVPQGCQWAEPM